MAQLVESKPVGAIERVIAVPERAYGPPSTAWEPPPGAPESYITVASAWNMLVKRRSTVIAAVLIAVTLAAIVTFRTKPVYRALARVSVDADSPTVQSLNEIFQKNDTSEEFVQTQIQVLRSDNLSWQTIEQLRLADDKHFIDAKTLAKLNPDRRKMELITRFKESLSVDLVPKTHMLIVGFESTDSRLAAAVATALVNNYVDYNFREKYNATRQVSGWLEQQLDEMKLKVEKSQEALVAYERQYAIANSGPQKMNVTDQMLSDLSKELTTARADRIQKQALYEQVKRNRAEIAAISNSDLLKGLETQRATLRDQYVQAMSQYGPNFPKVQRLQQQVAENDEALERERDRILERIRQDYLAAVNRESLAQAAVGQQREEVAQVNERLVQHNLLLREFESNQQLYQNLLQHLKDATVSAGLRSTNIHIVDAALPPDLPVRPKRLLNILGGLVGGMILGVVAVFLQEAFDHTVKTIEEVERLVAVPGLGVVPRDIERTGGSRSLKHPRSGVQSVGLTVTERPRSTLAEAYRALRTGILLSTSGQPAKVILVTSGNSGEGKTITAMNLAQAFAQRKGPVALVDCDLRKGGVARDLKISNKPGITEVLTGVASIEDVLHQHPALPDLYILPSGTRPPNPAELLSSDAISTLLNQLRGRFEEIIIDSPPLLSVTDGTVLASLADGVVVVAEPGVTHRGALIRTCKVLEMSGARVLGVVLNKFDVRTHGYGTYYYGIDYYKYSYGRAYGELDGSKSVARSPVH